MNNNDSILNALLSQQNTITLFWDSEDNWHVVKNTELLIKEDYYINNGLFDFFFLVVDDDRSGFIKFTNIIKAKKLSKDKNIIDDTIEAIFMLHVIDGMEIYYKFKCYENDNHEILIKIERLTMEDSYRYDIAQRVTTDETGINFVKDAMKMFKQYPNDKFAVVQFDIENFKIINRKYGEQFGDGLLKFILDGLNCICNNEQLYVRLSADVYMILTRYSNKQDLIDFICQIKDTINNYNSVNYKLVFGISIITDITKDLRKYSDGASIARQSIKNNALKYYAFYDESMIVSLEEEVWIYTHMEKALENNEFHMYLQPKYNMSTHKIVGAEALIRWINDRKDIINPVKFIPVFESNGFIKKIDKFIWEEACKCLRNWAESGIPLIPISVNVSRKHLKNLEYIETLESLLKKYNIDRKYLELEITETLDEPEIQDKLMLLKQHGFTILMDDFGSGYSSLNTLKDSVFDIVKLDKGFLTDFISSIKGQRIVKHIINMTKDIGIEVVAEGVETEQQADFLQVCGCNVAQGFLYARPMTVEDFNAICTKSLSNRE